MDESTQKDNSPQAIRERVENKRDEFAGAPEPGWQTLEATVDDTRHQAAQAWSGEGDIAAPDATRQSGTLTSDDQAQQPTGSAGEGQGVAFDQSRSQSAVNAGNTQGSAGQTSGTESVTPAGGSAAEAETPPFNDEHPLGVGQQCYKCGAYNDIEAGACWNCGEKLTPSMVETPGLTENVQGTDTGETATGMPADATSATDAGGARTVPSD